MKKQPTVIDLRGITKSFRLPHEKMNTLKSRILNLRLASDYDRLHVLKDITFEVNKGDFFGIVGKNGSGKSTLLKIIAGIYQPDQGEVEINGELAPFIEVGVGFNEDLTGRENVYLSGAILGMSRDEVRNKYDQIVAFSELKEFMDQKLNKYSSGMKVRLAFSVAIQSSAEILLVDEVLAVGDAKFQSKCFDIFRQYKKTGRTVIFVSHDMDKVQEYCNKAIYLKDGKVVAMGNPDDVATQYTMDFSRDIQLSSASKSSKNDVSIKSLLFNDGESVKVAHKDDKLEFTIEMTATRVSPIIVGIGLSHDDQYIGGFNTALDMPDLKSKKGLNKVKCVIDAGQLGKGAFKIDVLVSEKSEERVLLDRINRIATINITDNVINRDGVVSLKGKWSKEK